MIDRKRSRELRAALDAEEISYSELAEIESAFREIPRRELRDLPKNAMAGDQLDEIDAKRARDALTRLHDARSDASCARNLANLTLRLVAYLASRTEWGSDELGVLGEHVAAVTKRAGLPPAVDASEDAEAFWLDVCDALGIEYPEEA